MSDHTEWMIYGANGYTGRLVAAEARRRDLKPVLAGRRAGPIEKLAVAFRRRRSNNDTFNQSLTDFRIASARPNGRKYGRREAIHGEAPTTPAHALPRSGLLRTKHQCTLSTHTIPHHTARAVAQPCGLYAQSQRSADCQNCRYSSAARVAFR